MFSRVKIASVSRINDLTPALKKLPGFQQLGSSFEVSKDAVSQVVDILKKAGLSDSGNSTYPPGSKQYSNGTFIVSGPMSADNPKLVKFGFSMHDMGHS